MNVITEFLRSLKITYVIHNFFHRKELIHNEALYKQIGLHGKRYYSSISSMDFEGKDEMLLKQSFQNKPLHDLPLFSNLSEENKKSLLSFDDQGFAVLKNYVTSDHVDEINRNIEEGLASGEVKFENRNKIMFALHKYDSIAKLGKDALINQLLEQFIQGEPILFQSINFLMGSEQDTHSDSIHMTTFPLGGLAGVWVALEDIGEDNGPLHYYPGSHKLPYYLNKDYDNEGNFFKVGSKSYDAYEAFIAKKMGECQLPKVNFTCKKGDVLLWHANLFHGGNAHTNKSKTRKSMVFHYFKKGSICYHEITQRPALMKTV